MSAAEVLTSLAAAGAELVAEPAGLRVLAPVRLPGALLAAARDVKPALLRVASGRWRLDLAGWPGWRRDFFEERAAIREHDGMQPRDLAERCAYLEAAELPDPTKAPAPGPSWAQLEQPVDVRLEAPGAELPPDVDPADPAAPSPILAPPPPPAPAADPPEVPGNTRASAEAAPGLALDRAIEPTVDGPTGAALDLDGWPAWRVEFFLQRGAALVGVVSPEQAERQAYAEAAALTAPPGPAPAPARPARLPAHLGDTPEAWAAFLDEAPWIDPAERRRILADAFGSSPTPRPRSHP